MARDPEDLTIRILREIQATQAEHSRILGEHTMQFARLTSRLDEMHESMATALGLAAHADVRHDTVQKQLDELRDRLERLERQT